MITAHFVRRFSLFLMRKQICLVGLILLFLVLSPGPIQSHLYANGVSADSEHGQVESTGEAVPLALTLYQFVRPLGIATYSSLWITFLLGMLKFKFHVKKIDMRWHYGFAILTLVLATLHAAIVIGMEF